MKVFKFGGASVKDAEAVKNVAKILKNYDDNIVVVVSAMGKTTNALEKLTKAYFYKEGDVKTILSTPLELKTKASLPFIKGDFLFIAIEYLSAPTKIGEENTGLSG